MLFYGVNICAIMNQNNKYTKWECKNMFEKRVLIKNPTGLHARPAANLTAFCKKYGEDIKIVFGTMEINPKSIISILSAGVKVGSEVTVRVTGPGENKVGNELVEFLQNLSE